MIVGPVLVLFALGVVSWLVGSVQGRAVAAQTAAWLWGCLRGSWAWLMSLASRGVSRPGFPAAGAAKAGGKTPGGGRLPGKGKPSTGGVRRRGRLTVRGMVGKARRLIPTRRGSTPGSPSPQGSPPASPPVSPQRGRKGNSTRGGKGPVPPTVTVTSTTTITRRTRRTTPRDYTPHRAGDSGIRNTRESLRSHTVYGQTLAMVPAVTGTVAGYAFLIKRHRDEGEQHGLQGHAIALWDIAVQCAAAAEVAAEKAAQEPNDPGLRAAAERALDAAVEAVRDAAHFQASSLAALFAASDGSIPFLIPTIGLSGLRAAA